MNVSCWAAVSTAICFGLVSTCMAEVVVPSDERDALGGGTFTFKRTNIGPLPATTPPFPGQGIVKVGACVVMNAQVTIENDGRVSFAAHLSANPDRVYKTRLIFVDSRGRRLLTWPHIRLSARPILTERRNDSLRIQDPSIIPRIARVVRNDDCVLP